MIEIDTINMLSVQMSNMMKVLNRQARGGTSSSSNMHVNCFIYGGEHDTNECVDFQQA